MLINEDFTVIMKSRTAIKALFLYFNVCLSAMLDSLLRSFTSISFLTNVHEKDRDVVFLLLIVLTSMLSPVIR